MKYKLFFVIFISLAIVCCQKNKIEVVPSVSSDNSVQILILNNGAEYRGRLQSISEDNVVFVTNDTTMDIKKSEVSKINFSQKRLFESITNVSELPDFIVNAYKKSLSYKNAKSDSQYVNILQKRVYDIVDEQTVKYTVVYAAKILTKEGLSKSTQYFNYLKKNSEAKLDFALTITSEGDVFHVEQTAVNDEPVNNKYPTYDNEHRIKFGHKNVDVNSFIIWQATINTKLDKYFSPFFVKCFLIDNEPILEYEVVVNHPKEIKVDYAYNNGQITSKKPKISSKSTNFRMYLTNIASFDIDEEQMPPIDVFLPSLTLSVSYDFNEISTQYEQTFNCKNSYIYENYLQRISSKFDNTADFCEKIYNYVNRNINLVNVGMKSSQYFPNSDDVLCNVASLNPLDKAYLFVNLLKTRNIKADLYYYCSNSCVFNENFSNIKQFSNVLCRVNIDGNDVFACFDNQNYSFGVRPLDSSSAFCLCMTTASNLSQLPKIEPSANSFSKMIYATILKDGSLVMKQKNSAKGNSMSSWRSLRFLSKSELDSFVKKRAQSFGKDVDIIEFKILSDLNDFSKDIEIEESYKINNFAFASSDNLLFKVDSLGLKYDASSVSKQTRQLSFDLGSISESKTFVDITYPEEYKISFIPQDFEATFSNGTMSQKYRTDKNHIILDVCSVVSQRYVKNSDYKQLKECFEQRVKFFSQWIVLKK